MARTSTCRPCRLDLPCISRRSPLYLPAGADLDLSLVLPGDADIPDAAQRAMVSELAEKLEASGQYSSVFARPKVSRYIFLYLPFVSIISTYILP